MLRCSSTRRVLTLGALLFTLGACDEKSQSGSSAAAPEEESRDPVTGLTSKEAAEVLARVGDRKITLGEYAQSLARMDRFERLRYQSEERQRQLLDEMIETEILAQEARRRGLDKDPQVKLHLMQALRNELLEDLRRDLPRPEDIPESEVRDYYAKHQTDFVEPERRRVLVIEAKSEKLARELAERAQGASGQDWAELAQKYSLRRDRLGPEDASELAGDLGFVSAPGEERGENPEVAPAVRKAVFELSGIGDVAQEPAAGEGRFFVVRLAGISPKRERSFRDAGPAIRAELLRLKFAEAERRLLSELEKKYPARIDQAALAEATRDRKK